MGKTILVVDDERSIADGAARALENQVFSSVPLYNGAAAISMLQTMNVALILSDVNMPEIDGVELALETRQRWPHTKVLLMSGAETSATISQRLGGEGCPFQIIAKPFGIRELLDAVDDVLL